MAWTYTCDPLNVPLDAVRLHLGDTNENAPLLKDEEILYFLECNRGVLGAAAAAAEAVAAMFARQVDETTGDIKRSCAQRQRHFRLLADKLRKQAENPTNLAPIPYAGGISISDIDKNRADCDRFPDVFRVGQLDHRETHDRTGGRTFGDGDCCDE